MLVGAVAAVLLAGCAGTGAPQVDPDVTAPASSTPTPSSSSTPSPTSTLSAAQVQAVEEATAVAVAYRQMIADLYSGARTNLNDLDRVTTGELLDRTLMSVSKGITAGYRSVPTGVEVRLISAVPIKVQLDRAVPRVVLHACIDRTAITDVAPDGSTSAGVREAVNYYVIRARHLPAPGWALTKLTGEKDPKDRKC